ncbi:uncharacterized protein [Drosophila pseudoobscura]|uniref:Uncharacterized protein n=1 Tax=Drosophila pseudoobscura pseudoobscura TaxID=46245 RepID=A0A6I8VPT2_DROPS|nr:uncharacterized protein LOC6896908 [Drosophila pseudoobscura]
MNGNALLDIQSVIYVATILLMRFRIDADYFASKINLMSLCENSGKQSTDRARNMNTSPKTLGRVAVVVVLILIVQNTQGLFKATNIKCQCYDKTFCEFTQCELKVVGRGLVAINIYVKIHQLPVKKVLVNASLFRRFNGFRPFLYNITVDFCEFMKHSKRYPWFAIAHSQISGFSNLNHTCPYNVSKELQIIPRINFYLLSE